MRNKVLELKQISSFNIELFSIMKEIFQPSLFENIKYVNYYDC